MPYVLNSDSSGVKKAFTDYLIQADEILFPKKAIKQTPERICPDCKADRKEIAKSLCEGKGTDNYDIAIAVIENCPACKEAMFQVFQSED